MLRDERESRELERTGAEQDIPKPLRIFLAEQKLWTLSGLWRLTSFSQMVTACGESPMESLVSKRGTRNSVSCKCNQNGCGRGAFERFGSPDESK